MVCFEPPGRIVELAGVHGPVPAGLCATCADRSATGDLDGLCGRALRGWTDEYLGTVPDAVRAVLAWAGHGAPLVPVDPAPAALAPDDEAVWTRLRPLLATGPGARVSVVGEIGYDTVDAPSITTGVVLDGARVRLLGGGGQPWLIGDGTTTWRQVGDGWPAEPYSQAWAGHGSELAGRRRAEDVTLFGFGTPVGPVEPVERFGRRAWQLHLAAPAHKPSDLRIVVDERTGLVLEKQFGDRSVARWTVFDTDVTPSDELFSRPTSAG